MSNQTKATEKNHDLDNRKTQWHMAVTPAMKLEFMEYSRILDYIPEHLLNSKALQIDLLIIKKDSDMLIENEIGRFSGIIISLSISPRMTKLVSIHISKSMHMQASTK